MSDKMSKQDRIEALQKNEKQFGYLSTDEKGCMRAIPQKFIEKLTGFNGHSFPIWEPSRERPDRRFLQLDTYRISPDYKPDPEIVECEVKPDRRGVLRFYTNDGGAWHLHTAISSPNFKHFKFTDGSTDENNTRKDGMVCCAVIMEEV